MKSTLRHLVAFLIGSVPVAILVLLADSIRHGEVNWESSNAYGFPIPLVDLLPSLVAAVVLSWACGLFLLALLHDRRVWDLTKGVPLWSLSRAIRWMQVLLVAASLAGFLTGGGSYGRLHSFPYYGRTGGHLWTPFSLVADLSIVGFFVCCVAVGIMEALAWRRTSKGEESGAAPPVERMPIGRSTLLAAGQVLVGAIGVTLWARLYRVYHPLDRNWPLIRDMMPDLRRYALGMPLSAKVLLGLDAMVIAWAVGWCVWAFLVLLAWWRRGHNCSPVLLRARSVAARWAGVLFGLQLLLFFVVPRDTHGRVGWIVPILFEFPYARIVIDVWAALLGLSAIALTLWSVAGTVVESLARLLQRRDQQGMKETAE
ncbi:MAG TPA: hypothetical protein PLS53_05460 [Thermoanaerobaculaceae bacterium]|mgnify:CR=1 FL=1|nr:hypothetical protein [Thermoanaerobaculaceae bacterium]HPS77585.1 hypothetical protein [Thermoanaerobaculaceae bacterium]